MQAFIKFVAGSFDIAQHGTHVGLVTYGDNPNLAIAFNTLKGAGYNKVAFDRLVDAVQQQRDAGRRIDQALQMALTQLFTQQSGARADARKVSENVFNKIVTVRACYANGQTLLLCSFFLEQCFY